MGRAAASKIHFIGGWLELKCNIGAFPVLSFGAPAGLISARTGFFVRGDKNTVPHLLSVCDRISKYAGEAEASR